MELSKNVAKTQSTMKNKLLKAEEYWALSLFTLVSNNVAILIIFPLSVGFAGLGVAARLIG